MARRAGKRRRRFSQGEVHDGPVQWFPLSAEERTKGHVDVDRKEGIVHSECTSSASVSDVHMLPDLLHGAEKKVWCGAGYQGQAEAIHAAAPAAQDMTSLRAGHEGGVDQQERRKNRTKARARSKVEWPFRILKRVFGYSLSRPEEES